MTKIPIKQKVLVTVVKNRRDLNLVLKKKWYRIPIKYAPKQKFKYIAFYSPKSGNLGGKITYYASIKKITHATRQKLLPKEIAHPRAGNLYLRFELGKIYKLPRPIKNKNRRRVSFGFTTLSRLKKAGGPERLVPSKLEGSRGTKDILDLYDVPPIEEIFEKALKKAGIKYKREFAVFGQGRSLTRRYRLDFAVFYPRKKIAIECDGTKSHSLPAQKLKDRAKDKFLRANGWQVLRFTEKEIVENIENCIAKIGKVPGQGRSLTS